MFQMPASVPDDVLTALEKAFEHDDPETYARAIFFFDSIPEYEVEPYIRSLKRVIDKPVLFKSVAIRLVDDTKKADKDPRFRQAMFDVWNNYITENNQKQEGHGQGVSLDILPQNHAAVANHNFMRAVSQMCPARYDALVGFIDSLSSVDSTVARYAKNALEKARPCQALVRVGLVAGFLTFEICQNIRRWWKGEIEGTRCVKNIIDCGVSVAAGLAGDVGGEIAGAMMGFALAGPIGAGAGALMGGVAGGVASSVAARTLSDRLTQWFFGLPKSESLENAYRFFGLQASASNSDINSAYRQLALQYHPDKPTGDRDKWTKLQYHLAIIREARGEY